MLNWPQVAIVWSHKTRKKGRGRQRGRGKKEKIKEGKWKEGKKEGNRIGSKTFSVDGLFLEQKKRKYHRDKPSRVDVSRSSRNFPAPTLHPWRIDHHPWGSEMADALLEIIPTFQAKVRQVGPKPPWGPFPFYLWKEASLRIVPSISHWQNCTWWLPLDEMGWGNSRFPLLR